MPLQREYFPVKVQQYDDKFVLAQREPRYFVMQLGPDSFGYQDGYRYEVQLCNEALQAGAVILFRGDEVEFSIPEFDVPQEVYRAALRQLPGRGEFVDSQGVSAKRLW